MLGRTGAVFIPADAGSVTVPLRTTPPGTSADVEVRLDGRLADVVRVESDRWMNKLVVLPSRSGGPRYRKLELAVVGGVPDDGRTLLVGKVVAH